MKRMFGLLAAAALLLSVLCACGGREEEKVIALEDVYQGIMDAQQDNENGELVMFQETSTDVMDGFYPGLADVELNQQLLYMPAVYGFACEIMLVEVADPADVQTAKDILQARIDLASSDANYPENAKPWARNAQVQEDGRYLCMIVLPDGYTIPEHVFDLG